MSVPAWKQALLERRKKVEIEQQNKALEERQQLAALPPWKRALVLRQKEKEKKADTAFRVATVDRADSFTRRQVQVKANEERDAPAPKWMRERASSTVRATPPSKDAGGTRTRSRHAVTLASRGVHNASASASSASSNSSGVSGLSRERGGTVTVIPSASPLSIRRTGSGDSSVKYAVPLQRPHASKTDEVTVEAKRRSFEEDDPKYADSMPAWKKALLMRRRTQSESSAKKPELARGQRRQPAGEKAASHPTGKEEDGQHEAKAVAGGLPQTSVGPGSPSLNSRGLRTPPGSPTVAPKPRFGQSEQKSDSTRREPTVARVDSPKVKRAQTQPTATQQRPDSSRREPPVARVDSPKVKRVQTLPTQSGPPSHLAPRQPSKEQPSLASPTLSQPSVESAPKHAPSQVEATLTTSARKPFRAAPPKPTSKISAVRSRFERPSEPPPHPAPKTRDWQRPKSGPSAPTSKPHPPVEKPHPPTTGQPREERVEKSKPEMREPRAKPLRGEPKQPSPSSSTFSSSSKPPPPKKADRVPDRAAPQRPLTGTKPLPPVTTTVVQGGVQDSGRADKLLSQEGVTLHAPVFKEVDEWANVSEDDAKFKKLPLWKQALIRRRRKDIVRRTGTGGMEESVKDGLPESTSNGYPRAPHPSRDNAASVKTSMKPADKRAPEKTEFKQSRTGGVQNRPSAERKPAPTKPQTSGSGGGAVRALMNRFSAGGRGQSSGQQARPSYTAPSYNSISATNQRQTTALPPSASHRIMITGDEESSSGESDGEMEEIQLTNIDELSSDDDDDSDSGISKVRVISYNFHNGFDVEPPSPPQMERKTSASILVTPNKQIKRTLRRVSFSDSELTKEHNYPKYDYSDYDDIEENEAAAEASDGDERLPGNSGLSQRLHPFLRTGNSDSGLQRYSTPPTSPPSVSLQGYKPSVLSGLSTGVGSLEEHMSVSFSVANVTEGDGAVEESDEDGGPPDRPLSADLNAFYTSYKSDSAAILW